MNPPFCDEPRARFGRLLSAVLVVAAGCGGGDEEDDALRPVVEEIEPAIAAVEAERGGPQQYFEINATPQFVNLFVADDDRSEVQIYLYVDGALEPPTPPAPVSGGATFAATDLDFAPADILRGVTADLPDSDIVVFVVAAGPDGAPEYSAVVQSDQGGTLDIDLASSGEVLGVHPRE